MVVVLKFLEKLLSAFNNLILRKGLKDILVLKIQSSIIPLVYFGQGLLQPQNVYIYLGANS